MELGVHLPLIVADDDVPTVRDVADYAVLAERLGYAAIAASDHVVARSGWLDGVTALTIAAAASQQVQLVTAVLLLVPRQPAVVAKTLGTLDRLSGGRVVAGVGAGVSPADYAVVNIPFAERWQRFDAAVGALRRLWDEGGSALPGGTTLAPGPAQPGGPPIWIGSWGTPPGVRRAARFGDGWIASALNTPPAAFAAKWERVQAEVAAAGKDVAAFDNALASAFFYLTDDPRETERVVATRLAPALGRPVPDLLRAIIAGPADFCADRVLQYEAAGVQRLYLWPAAAAADQIRRFAAQVMPRLGGRGSSKLQRSVSR